jgi:hypothetical protein
MGKLRLELDQTKFELARYKDESRSNADATLQRKALHAQLSMYPQLLEENETLRRENKLLIETAENSEVLVEKVKNLEADLDRALHEAAQGAKAKQVRNLGDSFLRQAKYARAGNPC